MSIYLYSGNVSPNDRFTQLQLQMDNGSVSVIRKGRIYDLTASEAARARSYVVLTPSEGPVTAAPKEVALIPILGTLEDGDVPVWDSSLGYFVPTPVSGVGGGGGTGPGEGRVLLWDTDTANYVPAELRSDTSLPREFRGPVDPETIGSITGPVFGDAWSPSEEPA